MVIARPRRPRELAPAQQDLSRTQAQHFGMLVEFAAGNGVCKPKFAFSTVLRDNLEDLTLPSAQLFIDSSGRFDRCIEVVYNHCGIPRRTTTAQKENKINIRVHEEVGRSGGGFDAAAFEGPSEDGTVRPPSLATAELIYPD